MGFSAVCRSQICTAEPWLRTEVEATQEMSVLSRLLPALSLLSPMEGMEMQQHSLSFAQFGEVVASSAVWGPAPVCLEGRILSSAQL